MDNDTPRVRDYTGTREQPIDPRGGPPEHFNVEVSEMSEGEREQATYLQRLFDAGGRDSAYELGLSRVRLPAPKGGWPASTPREKLIV